MQWWSPHTHLRGAVGKLQTKLAIILVDGHADVQGSRAGASVDYVCEGLWIHPDMGRCEFIRKGTTVGACMVILQ